MRRKLSVYYQLNFSTKKSTIIGRINKKNRKNQRVASSQAIGASVSGKRAGKFRSKRISDVSAWCFFAAESSNDTNPVLKRPENANAD